MKILGVKVPDIWVVIRAIEKKNLSEPYSEPIVVLTDTTTATHHAGLLLLNNYYKKMEKIPDHGMPDTEIKAIKRQNTFNGCIECQYCKQEIGEQKITMDHWIPFYLGGKTSYGNLRLSCPGCNGMKGSIHPLNMPKTWALFQRNIQNKHFVKALTIIEEVLTLTDLSQEELKLAKKLYEKELQWRAEMQLERSLKLEENQAA